MESDTTTVIEPISASADGKRNGYNLNCEARGQRMSYAACLWRQGVLDNPKTKVPDDWQSCKTAACSGKCVAVSMREEEVLAGKSLYFVCRDAFRKLADVAKDWNIPFRPSRQDQLKQSTMTYSTPKEIPVATEWRSPVKKEVSALDALSHVGDFAKAITAAAKDQSATLVKKVVESEGGVETPLQMARRLNALKTK